MRERPREELARYDREERRQDREQTFVILGRTEVERALERLLERRLPPGAQY